MSENPPVYKRLKKKIWGIQTYAMFLVKEARKAIGTY